MSNPETHKEEYQHEPAQMKFAVLGLAIVAATVLTIAGPGRNSERRANQSTWSRGGSAFSNGLAVGNTLYLSGQEGW